jgi:hypothetical protein
MIELKLTVDIPALDRLIPILEKYQSRLGIADGEPAIPPYTAPDMPLPTEAATAPAPAPVTPAPVAAPAFTVEQVAKAGAALLTSKPDLMGPLQELLTKYGVASVKELPADQLGAFAAELRKMGAKI